MISVVAGFSLGFTPGGARVDTAGATRRAVLSKVFGGAVAIAAPQLAGAVTAKTGLSSQFTGDYNDPLHPEFTDSLHEWFFRSGRATIARITHIHIVGDHGS